MSIPLPPHLRNVPLPPHLRKPVPLPPVVATEVCQYPWDDDADPFIRAMEKGVSTWADKIFRKNP
jgi:hypothetical protein